MAHAPIHAASLHHTPQGPEQGKTLSLIKEKTKAELFKAIEDQNILHGDWQKKVKDWYKDKVEKMMERTENSAIAEELATKQIQKIW